MNRWTENDAGTAMRLIRSAALLALLWLALFALSKCKGAEPPFPVDLPPGAPPVINWYVAEPNQTVIWPSEVWTVGDGYIEYAVANADPNGEMWSFAWSDPNVDAIDPNLHAQPYKYRRQYQIGWTAPATAGVYYIRVTAALPKVAYGEHDLRPRRAGRDSATYVFLVEQQVPPIIIGDLSPIITGKEGKIWMDLYASALKGGRQLPSKPAQVLQ